ncbi:MAG: hypothetical protein Q8P67_24450 [archaeon]|nr:hypothetical protein [archaeon]
MDGMTEQKGVRIRRRVRRILFRGKRFQRSRDFGRLTGHQFEHVQQKQRTKPFVLLSLRKKEKKEREKERKRKKKKERKRKRKRKRKKRIVFLTIMDLVLFLKEREKI